jgi:histidinol-phosphate aminotransferase
LLHRGVIVRPLAAFGLADAFRVTVGLHEHNLRFLNTLADVSATLG